MASSVEWQGRLHPSQTSRLDEKIKFVAPNEAPASETSDLLKTASQPRQEQQTHNILPKMHLMYTLDANGKRLYTLNKVCGILSHSASAPTNTLCLQVQAGEVTKSAHPARFSPDDKYSSKASFTIGDSEKRGS